MKKKLDKFTREKQWKYREIINPILSELQAALILHKLKYGNKGRPETAQLTFNENREIGEINSDLLPKKGPVDIKGKAEDIRVKEIYEQASKKINSSTEIIQSDKERLINGINEFINKEFWNKRKNLEDKSHLPNKQVRNYYTNLSYSLIHEGKLSLKEGVIYREICIALSNILYEKNHDYVQNGQITQAGLYYIGSIFFKTIKNISYSGSSKGFDKIFHDGDFNFLGAENSEGEPKIGTLDHYVKAIMYLMNSEAFNAYAEGGKDGAEERYKSRKKFLNNLFNTINLEDEKIKLTISNKGILHKKMAEQRTSIKDIINKKVRDFSNRLKTFKSKMLKISRTLQIRDESGIRATYYGEMNDKQGIKDSIITMCRAYLEKIYNINGIKIISLQTDRKGDFITKDDESEIIEELGQLISEKQNTSVNISQRAKPSRKNSKLERISGTYAELEGRRPWEGLEQAYEIANGSVIRGSNGKYEDFKLVIQFLIDSETYNENIKENESPIDKDVEMSQEISFYPHNNDLGIGNHNFLDLEKMIFNEVRTMDDPDFGKSISLDRLRVFTEKALKNISFDIDMYQDKIKRGLLPSPENDDYKYLKPDGKYIEGDIQEGKGWSLEGLTYRTKENSERFDELICIIINYFIKKNKIFYINTKNENFHGLITKEQLYDKNRYKIKRFSTSDALRDIALDGIYREHSICIYTDKKKNYGFKDFYIINLGELGDFINLEQVIKN